MRLLFIFAHLDDAEIYSGGLISKLKSDGFEINVCCVKNNIFSCEENIIRNKEFDQSMKIIGIKPDRLGFIDGEKILENDEKKLIDYINLTNPDIIITHNTNDYHFDHRDVARVVIDSASYKYPVLMTDTLCGNDVVPSYYCDITNFMDIKKKMIRCYKSQLLKCDYIEMVKVLNSYRFLQYTGKTGGFCEAYSCYSLYHKFEIDSIVQSIFL